MYVKQEYEPYTTSVFAADPHHKNCSGSLHKFDLIDWVYVVMVSVYVIVKDRWGSVSLN